MFDPKSFAHRFWPSFRRGSLRGRSGLIVWAALWVVLRLPIAVPDFHAVAHHHFEGADCLYHEHLNRWHGPVNTGESATDHEHELATLHWHWVIPGSNMPEGQSDRTGAQDTDQAGPQITQGSGGDFLGRVIESARLTVTIDRAGSERSELLDLAVGALLACAGWFDVPPRCAHRAFVSQLESLSSLTPASFQPLRC